VTDIAPPAVNVWDVPAVTDAALATLRLAPTDPAADLVAVRCAEAVELIDVYLDRVEPLDTSVWLALQGAASDLGVALYRRKDASTGMQTGYSPPAASFDVADDPLDLVRAALRGHKQRFGIG
jgi:hypothetical protein